MEGGVGKYLGLPENFGRKKKDVFASIVDRIKQKAMSWSTKFLSTAGRLVLLKSVLSALPIYTMSSFKLPISLCKKIQSILTRFWWDGSSEKKKMSWVAWKKLARPNGIGGLGLRDIQNFNDALLGKIAWRILNHPKSLLSRVLKGKYCVGSTFLECEAPSVLSHGWRGVLIGRDVIKKRLGMAIGTGTQTKVWKDNWLLNDNAGCVFGPPIPGTEDTLVSDLLTPDKQNWDCDKIDQLIPHCRDSVLGLRHSKTGAEDRICWLPTKDGNYTVRSGYFELMNSEPSDHPCHADVADDISWFNQVWNVKCPPKLQLFLWKICNRALPTGHNLQSRGINISPLCARCGQLETTEHVLFSCPYATEVWNQIQWATRFIPGPTNTGASLKSALLLKSLPPYGISQGPFAPWLLWFLWKSRNSLIFQDRNFSVQETVLKALVEAREWQCAQDLSSTASTGQVTAVLRTLPPPSSLVCINTDAAWSVEHKLAGIGLVITNLESSNRIVHQQLSEFVHSPLMGEALAILAALQKASQLDLKELHIFSDSKTCVDSIIHNVSPPEIHGVCQDIKALAMHFDAFSISFISRSCNSEADSLAKDILAESVLDRSLNLVTAT